MKKAILIMACALISVTAIAQTNSPVVKKDTVATPIKPAAQEFKQDPAKVYTIALNVNAAAISALITSPEEWAGLRRSQEASAAQVSAFEDLAKAVRAAILNQKREADLKDYDAFMAKQKPAAAKPKK